MSCSIGLDPLHLNLCISAVPFSFGVWCQFCPSRVTPSDSDTVCKNGAQVSRRIISFSPTFCFGGRHASIPDRPFYIVVLATLSGLSHQERAMPSDSVFPAILIPWTSTDPCHLHDKYVVATFMSRYIVIEYVLASELLQVATWLS